MKHHDISDGIQQQIYWSKEYGIKDFDISGGEPSILPYWFEILKQIQYYGFRNIACITNGYKFSDPEFTYKSKQHGLNELLFSLHGNKEETHDGMTGVKGSYKKIHLAISSACRYDIKRRINVVVTKDNYKELPELARYANYISPVAFNFLPFRMENSASKENALKYTKAAKYIKKAIDILNKDIKISVRYIPFCVMEGYEQYVAGYLQRMFDEYEWSEYCIRKFENVRFARDVPELDCETDKWQLEIDAIHKSIKHVANHKLSCLKCKYLNVCDGIWYSYADIWGTDEFNPIEGEKILNIIP
jgi:MoaA/NifB/PqqE/SkfB family radical SAM enzyme